MDNISAGEVKIAYFRRAKDGRDQLAIISGEDCHTLIRAGWNQITAEDYANSEGVCVLLDLRRSLSKLSAAALLLSPCQPGTWACPRPAPIFQPFYSWETTFLIGMAAAGLIVLVVMAVVMWSLFTYKGAQ